MSPTLRELIPLLNSTSFKNTKLFHGEMTKEVGLDWAALGLAALCDQGES